MEDIGGHNFQVWTESAAWTLGSTAAPAELLDSVSYVATDTQALGVIRWAVGGSLMRTIQTTGSDDPAALSTTLAPAFFNQGPAVVYGDSAYSTVAVVGLDSDDEPRPHEYMAALIQNGAVAITGGLSLYLKYNFADFQIREPSSNLGDTGD